MLRSGDVRRDPRWRVLGLIIFGSLLGTTSAARAQLASCDFGTPHPDAPAQTADFEFLIGNWEIAVRQPDESGDWGDPVARAYWEGRWALGGFAVVDYWYDGIPWEAEEAPGRGVNTRMFDSENGVWQMAWQHTGLAGVRRLQARREGGEVAMWQLNPDGSRLARRRTRFHDIRKDSWVRTDWWSDDDGETWEKALRLEATRLPCPVVGADGREGGGGS